MVRPVGDDMKIKSINLSKSKTIGIQTADNRTRFRKLQISVQADIAETDNPAEEYKKLSEFIEEQFIYESNIK